MNIKLHTPKSLKAGSGLATLKQFLLSLVATSISIMLTFGTAAIIDNYKKEAAKREIVMTVLYDFEQSIAIVEKVDTALREASRLQQQLAVHPEYFDSLRTLFLPVVTACLSKFPGTTERIFTTSIETFNTIGNVSFVSEATDFYVERKFYTENVLESITNEVKDSGLIQSQEALFRVSFPEYVYINGNFLIEMKAKRDRCMKMMDISEKDMKVFSQQRTTMDDDVRSDSLYDALYNQYKEAEKVIEQYRGS